MTSTNVKKLARSLMKSEHITYTEALAHVYRESLGLSETRLTNAQVLDYAKVFSGFRNWLRFGLAGPGGFNGALRSPDGSKYAYMGLVTKENNDWTWRERDARARLKELEGISGVKAARERLELELDLEEALKIESEALRENSTWAPWYPGEEDIKNGVEPGPELDNMSYLPESLEGLSHLVFAKGYYDETEEFGWEPFVSACLKEFGGSINPDVVNMQKGKVTGIDGDNLIYIRVGSFADAREVLERMATFMDVGEDTGNGWSIYKRI